jgi:hypothetical protein
MDIAREVAYINTVGGKIDQLPIGFNVIHSFSGKARITPDSNASLPRATANDETVVG